jgi:hypothetical protein
MMIHYVVIILLIIGIVVFTLKAHQIFKNGLEKTYAVTGRQILIQYVLLILLALSIIFKNWEKLSNG